MASGAVSMEQDQPGSEGYKVCDVSREIGWLGALSCSAGQGWSSSKSKVNKGMLEVAGRWAAGLGLGLVAVAGCQTVVGVPCRLPRSGMILRWTRLVGTLDLKSARR